MKIKAECESYLAARGFPSRLHVTVHVGEVAIGLFGAGYRQELDILGDEVNTAASLARGGHRGRTIISPQAFRRLAPSTRRLFHRFTEPIVYLAEE